MATVRALPVYAMLAVAVLLSTPVYAQVSGATLAGTVMDASGAVVVNAKVSIRNTATDVTRDVTTDSSGLYSAPNLLPGIYDITIIAPGFSTSVQTGLTLTVGATQALNISLQIGRKTERFDVSAITPDVQLSSSIMSGSTGLASTTIRMGRLAAHWASIWVWTQFRNSLSCSATTRRSMDAPPVGSSTPLPSQAPTSSTELPTGSSAKKHLTHETTSTLLCRHSIATSLEPPAGVRSERIRPSSSPITKESDRTRATRSAIWCLLRRRAGSGPMGNRRLL